MSVLRRALAAGGPGPAAGARRREAATNSDFQPIDEFIVKPWFSIQIGPFDLGISKAIVYLWIAALISIALALWICAAACSSSRDACRRSSRRSTRSRRRTSAGRRCRRVSFTRWFPYVASLFVFIWTLNMISFIPLPLDTHNTWAGGIPGFTIYAATSNLSVTLALTLLTIVISHVEGIRANGVRPYFKTLGAGHRHRRHRRLRC